MQDSMSKYWSERLNIFFGMSKQQFDQMVNNYSISESDTNIGFLTITDGIDYVEEVYQNLLYDGTNFMTKDGQLFMTMPKVNTFTPWDEKVESYDSSLLKYHHPYTILRKLIRLMLNDAKNIRSMILNRKWGNVSRQAREKSILHASLDRYSLPKMLASYIFTGHEPEIRKAKYTTFKYNHSDINLNFVSGDLVCRFLDEHAGGLYFRNKMIMTERAEKMSSEVCYIGMSGEIELKAIPRLRSGIPHKPYSWILTNAKEIKEGTILTTNISGQNYLANKNINFAVEMSQTIDRCLLTSESQEISVEFRALLKRKRELDTESSVDDTELAVKRARTLFSSSS